MIPETETDIEELIQSLSEQEKRKKLVNIIVVAEGDKYGANEIVIDVSCIPNGFYNVHCYSNNKLYKTKLLKI